MVIGASAGGLDAVSELLQSMPVDSGLAFLYVQHLSPDHESSLPLLLSRSTKMKVLEVANQQQLKADHVYVCIPNKEIRVEKGRVRLTERNDEKLPYLPIDDFFVSLASAYKGQLVGIILSGNATDGSIGLKAIMDAGGLTFAQDSSAKYNSMPASAINEGGAALVLSPKAIARELVHFAKTGNVGSVKLLEKDEFVADSDPDLNTIFSLLHKHNGVDFSHYKMSTIKRRIQRRIQKNNLKTIKEYLKLLKTDSKETELLYTDLLINVTSFFRDKEIFRYLKSRFLPRLLKETKDNKVLRIWVPACSSGEEVYTIAMLITELQDKQEVKIPVRIFASDLSEQALSEARIGEYSESDLGSIAPAYLKRFFVKSGGKYRVVKELREMCVFVTHNILRDPPFSRMDFISCRNLLIYFDAAAQKKVMATLHFALNDSGYLLLGKSETIGTSSLLFTQLDIGSNIYSRKKNSDQANFRDLEPRFIRELTPSSQPLIQQKQNQFDYPGKMKASYASDLDGAIDSLLLSSFMPACAVINKNMEIIQFRGDTSLFLSHSSGKASLNILKMIRPEFSFELRDAIRKVLKTKQKVTKEGIEVRKDAQLLLVSLIVSIVKVKWDEPLMLVIFKPAEHVESGKKGKGARNVSSEKDKRIKKLTEELNTASAEMHEFIVSQEQAYEELQAANEEIVSTNEEFQTLNEELESTKEEIEATNEELTSTNQELQMRNELLMESDSYSEAIISTLHEPMLVLNKKFEVRSASKSFCKKFNLDREEIEGKPFFEFGKRQWNIPELRERLEDIIAKNVKFENFEVTHTFPEKGQMVMMLNASRIIQKIHGEQLILLAIEDITEIRKKQSEQKEAFQQHIKSHKEERLELEKAVKRRTKQLEFKNDELSAVNKDLEAFNYVSSHDLQEPLRKIQNFTSLILKDKELKISREGSTHLKKLRETAKRMQSLIEDLLTYSRTKRGERNFETEKIANVIQSVRNDLSELIAKQKAVITVDVSGEAEIIKFQFRQLFHNLFTNSIKFASPKRKLRITIGSHVAKGSRLKFRPLSPDVKYCHITFTDNGIGFEPQYKDRIFEVFQRLHTMVEYTGTGIGLSICKRIVENHNGFITATGELNKGAQFDIYIPLSYVQK